MKTRELISLFLFLPVLCFAQQSDNQPAEEGKFFNRIFLPSIEIGIAAEEADPLEIGLIIKTSVEYRTGFDAFMKVNFDATSFNYEVVDLDGFTNIVKGKTTFEDLVFGVGYRLGHKEWRSYLLYQAGIRIYDYPSASQEGNTISIDQNANSVGLHRIGLGGEFYFDPQSSFTAEFFMGSVWDKVDFWESNRMSYGAVIGFSATIF